MTAPLSACRCGMSPERFTRELVMINHEPQTEQPTPAGQIRLQPDELSRALAAIEQHKQEEAQRLARTIPIEEAVSALSIDATPEEIWAEVQAQRAAEAQRTAEASAQQAQSTPIPQRQARTVTQARGRRRPWRGVLLFGAAFWVLHTMGVVPHLGPHSHPAPPGLTATLAQIPDGKQFYGDNAALIQISEGKPLPQVHVNATQPFGNSWTLVKMAGHIYLRAYTLPITSLQARKGQTVVLYNDDNSGALRGKMTAQTVLRVDHVPLQTSGGDDAYTEITVPNFQPDPFTTTSAWR